MTPDKHKKPLPLSTSTSIACLKQPQTCEQWRGALQRVKILYLKNLWKQCSQRCNQLLLGPRTQPHPLQITYLYFYSALSSEALARGIHTLSMARLQILEEARSSYQAAAAHISVVDKESALSEVAVIESAPRQSSFGSGRNAKSPCNSKFSVVSNESDVPAVDAKTLKPSPLCVRKQVCFEQDVAMSNIHRERPLTPPCTPPPSIQNSPFISPPDSTTSDRSTEACLYNRTRQQYRLHLTDFTSMLENHIHTIDNLIKATQAAQTTRYCNRASKSSKDDDKANAIDLKERIARLKANTWNRERFDAEKKYQKLCVAALAEL